MAARHTTSRSLKSITGVSILAVGLFLLFDNLGGAATQLSRAAGAPAEALGILPALVLAGLHGVQAYIFDHSGFLSSLQQILVSCWPLLLIAAGAILLRPLVWGKSGRRATGRKALLGQFEETTNAR
jgi:hypothetical protein